MNWEIRKRQSLLFFALFITGLLAFVGVAVDAGRVFWTRAELSSRADAAALAGGAELPNPVQATRKVYEYLALHNITPDNHTIEIGFTKLKIPNDTIRVKLSRELPMAFLQIIGIREVTVEAEAIVHATQWSGTQTWSMFRGNAARTGYQECHGLDAQINQVQYEFGYRWNLQDGANHRSTPAVYQDERMFGGHPFIVVGSNDNNFQGNDGAADGGAKVYAFDGVTGKTLWLTNLGPTKVRSSPLITVIPGFNENYPVIYVNGHNGKVYALDARDGHVLWVSANNNDDFEDDGLYRSSPALLEEGGNYYIYTATSRGNVYKFNAKTGAMIWRSTPFPEDLWDVNTGSYPNPNVPQNWVTTSWGVAPGNSEDYWGYSPIYATVNVAYIPEMGKRVIFLAAHGDRKWTWPNGEAANGVYLFAIDAATGAKIWSALVTTDGNNRDSSAVGKVDVNYDGVPDEWRVYVAATDGYLYAFNALNGSLIWKIWTGDKHHRSDPILYCGVVFGGNESGIWAFTAAAGVPIWNCTDEDGPGPDQANPYCNDGNYNGGLRRIPGGVKSAPAIVDGIIMVGANKTSTGGAGGSMWALEARTGRALGVWNTTDWNPGAGIGLMPPRNTDYVVNGTLSYTYDPQIGPSGNNGDVRSGVVVGPDFNAYFGSNDGGLYQVHITPVLVIIK